MSVMDRQRRISSGGAADPLAGAADVFFDEVGRQNHRRPSVRSLSPMAVASLCLVASGDDGELPRLPVVGRGAQTAAVSICLIKSWGMGSDGNDEWSDGVWRSWSKLVIDYLDIVVSRQD